MTEQISDAFARWADEVAALGGAEPLTRFRDLKSGTLDLAGADADARRTLLDGEPVRVSRLFPHDPIRTAALRSGQRLAERLHALAVVHGLAAGYLATGLATWNDRLSARRPMAPVLLRRVQAVSHGDDVLLHVVGEPELNGLLLDAMAQQLGLRLTADDLLDPSGELRYPVVVDRLREQAPPHIIDGFTIHHRAVIGAMSSVPENQAGELRALAPQLAAAPLVALAAGLTLEPVVVGEAVRPSARTVPPLDLDAAQAEVLASVAAGRSVAVDTPPGTGAVQVAAALCAEAVDREATVLVVAEAGARLQSLARRLAQVGLGGVVLDLSDGLVAAPSVARDVLVTLDAAAPRVDRGEASPDSAPHPAAHDQALLTGYHDALHRIREPWGLSAFDAISRAGAGDASAVRLERDDLMRLDGATLAQARDALAGFVDLDGLRVGPQATAWFGARPSTQEQADRAVALATDLHDGLTPTARELSARAAVEVGMPAPASPAQARDLADLLAGVAAVEQVVDPEVWAGDVDRLAAAVADRRTRRELPTGLGFRERRALRARARGLARDPAVGEPQLAAALAQAAELERLWVARSRDGRRPRRADTSDAAVQAVRAWSAGADELSAVHPDALSDDLDFAGAQARLGRLVAEAGWMRRLPALTRDAALLAETGLGPLVADLRARVEDGERVDAAAATAALDACVAASVAEEILSSDPVLLDVDSAELRAAAQRWRLADAAEVVDRSHGIWQGWQERVRRASTERPVHLRALRDAAAGRDPRPVRELVSAAADTLRTARPVWLAGPLTAADVLPPRVAVDLLVVLDAQSVALARAVGVLARARQVVLLGDPQLPPPVAVPVSVEAPDPRATTPVPGTSVETPSVLAVLRDQLEQHRLTTRYGCHDERLHALLPQTRPPRRLSVPPGAAAAAPVRFVHVPQPAGSRDQEESVAPEVAAVVDLVGEHVEHHPDQSLAVLTLGTTHAEALRAALARASAASPALARALGPDAEEPFLLRPVDDLHSERRDAVILTVGFGRTVDGRLLYRFGPVNRPGGVRWLAAAVGTARAQLTVVSSIRADELEPRRLAADGVRGLRDLLAAAEGIDVSSDPAAGGAPAVRPGLDPFDAQVGDRLRAAGLPVVLGSGIGGLEVPLVLEHPGRSGRGLVAIETDGAPVSALRSVRDRERMRPEQLMRAGWAVARICAVAWARDPDAEIAQLGDVWEVARERADAWDAAAHAPAPSPDDAPAQTASGPASAGRDAEVSATSDGPLPDRPPVPAGRLAEAYPPADLLTLAAWVDACEPESDEQRQVSELAHELALGHVEDRAAARLRQSVRAAAVLTRARRDGPAQLRLPHPLAADEGADAQERLRESAGDADAHEQWLEDQRPPHHG